uniref:DDE_Tnp_IS1595 domain-containing protein n=1 Tax=Trichuris muris TaxID=70415 RepID=A0A5S6Q7C2_TRIMR
MNQPDILSTIAGEHSALSFLHQHGILHQRKYCTCLNPVAIRWRVNWQHATWRCSRKVCRKEVTVRKGTWLEDTQLELRKVVMFLFSWSQDKTAMKFCQRSLGMSKSARQIVLRGPKQTVDVDESVFSKRKNNRGRYRSQQWVFAAVCRETEEGFIVPVPDRSSRTLLPLIRQHIASGSTIVSDEWRAYAALSSMGYAHLRVNHSANFVDPRTWAHTHTIEGSRRIKDFAERDEEWRSNEKLKCGDVDSVLRLKWSFTTRHSTKCSANARIFLHSFMIKRGFSGLQSSSGGEILASLSPTDISISFFTR